MTRYRRLRRPGGTYFFTLCLEQRDTGLLTAQIDLLRSAWRATLAELPVVGQAVVVLPDHLHAVWTELEGEARFPERWRRIKARFSHALNLDEAPSRPSLRRRRERGIWQRRYWEHAVRDEAELHALLDYCRFNPVKHGLVEDPGDWPYSSFSRARMGRHQALAVPCSTAGDGQIAHPTASGHAGGMGDLGHRSATIPQAPWVG